MFENGFYKKSISGAVLALSMCVSVFAVHIYDGVRAPEGLYFLSYSTLYSADDFTDSSGHSINDDFGYLSVKQLLRLSWYTRNALLTVLAPFGSVDLDSADASDDGLGDALIGGGVFLPIESFDCLAMVVADVPTGEFDESRTINMGSGQWNIRPSLFVHKAAAAYTIDGVVKYNFRQENHDTNFDPGDEFSMALVATRKVGRFRIGPNVCWMKGEDQRQDGHTQPDSAKQMLSAGLEAYTRFPGWGATLNYMADIYSENTVRGHLLLLKFVHKF